MVAFVLIFSLWTAGSLSKRSSRKWSVLCVMGVGSGRFVLGSVRFGLVQWCSAVRVSSSNGSTCFAVVVVWG